MANRLKVSIIGAGNVGAACAQRIVEREYTDVVLLDIVDGLPQGKALDIAESAPILGFDARITGSNDYKDTAGSDVVVITSGMARKPGMSRDDLLQANATIVGGVVKSAVADSPECTIIVATNPVDAMTHLALDVSQFPRNRVFGLSGVLDGARLASFIAEELGVSVTNVAPCVLGEHGKNMVVVPRLTLVNGTPIIELLSENKVEQLVERTIGGGAEIVGLLKTGSAFQAPSAAIDQMVAAVLLDTKQILSCAARLEGEYGVNGTVISVPVKLGRGGIEQVVGLALNASEKEALDASVAAVRELVGVMQAA